ncbi:DUF2892 domain-containing protein [Candidatus Woesearchaeota archaeon]|nr:DUF2892 domain-containing protein [Candidatus Woesearchaeota archaeon]
MKKNLGVFGRVTRFVGGLILIYLAFVYVSNSLLKIIFVIFGIIGIIEAVISYCGLKELLVGKKKKRMRKK